jgi:hypothetical protein
VSQTVRQASWRAPQPQGPSHPSGQPQPGGWRWAHSPAGQQHTMQCHFSSEFHRHPWPDGLPLPDASVSFFVLKGIQRATAQVLLHAAVSNCKAGKSGQDIMPSCRQGTSHPVLDAHSLTILAASIPCSTALGPKDFTIAPCRGMRRLRECRSSGLAR